jgi:methionyl-tRNA formyltransferase
MRSVIVLGEGELVIRIAEWFRSTDRYKLRAIIPVIPEPEWAPSFIAWGNTNNIKVVESGHYKDVFALLKITSLDVIVSVAYNKVLPEWFITKCGRALNIHGGPLPEYRGVSPINWALTNAERVYGVTIHEISPEIDSGPIIAQAKFSIYPELDEVIDVIRRVDEYAWLLFQHTMPLLDYIKAQPQDESLARYYSKKDRALLRERAYLTRQEYLDAITK